MSFGIKGFEPTSLTDWPGKISAVIFLPRCNFRCHYCYNPEFIKNPDKLSDIPDEKIFSYLEKKKKWIDGVVMLGGEPTIHPAFMDIVKKIKSMDLGVCLHTNGTNPDIIQELLKEKLVNYFAMDIKTAFEYYEKVTDVNLDIEKIKKSARLIMDSGIDYEFRTTIVPGLFGKKEMEMIGKELSGARAFYLQQFKSGNTLDPKYKNKKPYLLGEVEELAKIARKYFKKVEIRS